MRDPRTHQIEHVAVDPELVIEVTDRSDGMIVEMSDQAGLRIEARIAGRVSPVKEAERKWITLHLLSLSRLTGPAPLSLNGHRFEVSGWPTRPASPVAGSRTFNQRLCA